MGKKSPPPAPDYASIAKQQSQASKELTQQQTVANRPNITTPWGSQTWTQNGDKWATNIALSPQQQAALDSQMAVTQGRSEAAQGLLGQATGAFNSPMDYSGITAGADPMNPTRARSSIADSGDILNSFDRGGQVQDSFNQGGPIQTRLNNTAGDWRQKAQDAALAFMKPQQEQRQQALESQLANMGLTRGSQAWNSEMQRLQDQNTRDSFQAFGAGQSEANMLFGQDLASGQFANSAQQQGYNQGLGAAEFANRAQNQNFGQNAAMAAFNNQAQGQQRGQNVQDAQLYNQAAMQNNNADQMAGNFNQQLRQQQIAEMLQKRNQPLNELNALLTGQQVNSPNMPSFNTAGRAETPQLLNAANMGYQAQMDAFNAEQAGLGGLTNGLFSLGSAAMGSPTGWAGLFNMSDFRLKKDIFPLALLANGIQVVTFRFKDDPTGEVKIGVIAQDVEKIMPEAVYKGEDGYLRVNYNMVFA